jgi:predicted RNase H-like nuclease (RuvC/YqgF family)
MPVALAISGEVWTMLASIFVALISLGGGVASQRAASRASQQSTRAQVEQGAYERAEKILSDTIKHQDNEIAELRTDVDKLRDDVRRLRESREQDRRAIREKDRLIATQDDEIRRLAAVIAARGES